MADYIEREKAHEHFAGTGNLYEWINRTIDEIPAADVRPVVRGEWIGEADGYADGELVYDMWHCSVCGYDADNEPEKPSWNYCPNCGAKMGE